MKINGTPEAEDLMKDCIALYRRVFNGYPEIKAVFNSFLSQEDKAEDAEKQLWNLRKELIDWDEYICGLKEAILNLPLNAEEEHNE